MTIHDIWKNEKLPPPLTNEQRKIIPPPIDTPYNNFTEWTAYKANIRAFYNNCIDKGILDAKFDNLYPKLLPFLAPHEIDTVKQKKPLKV